ncbi:MAG: peptide ABC transporter substrate-binding protein [Dehalococcoidia bacterium]
MNVRNRWFLILAGLLASVLVFAAACGGDDDDGDGGDQTPSATQPAGGNGETAPADQQNITIQSGEPQFLDPHRSNFEQDIGVIRMMFRGLYNLTDDGGGGVEVVPGMAEGDPVVEGNVYTVTLKEGLLWSDGEPITAQNFVDGAKRGCDPTVAETYGYLWGAGYLDLVGCAEVQANTDAAQKQTLLDAMQVRAVDERTVEYTLKQPNDRFTTIMALWVTFPARQDVIDANGDAWTQPENIVNNGPFVLSELTPGESLKLVPNPNWAGQAPALQEITVRFIDDLAAAFRGYQNDELQMTRISATDIVVVEGDSGLSSELLQVPSGRIESLEMQMEDETLADFNVRLALSRAIDREALNEAVFDGTNQPALYWVVEGITGHQGNEPFTDIIGFDEEAAKAALAEAGYPGGDGFPELGIIVNTPERIAVAEFLQQQFSEILGIDIRIEQVDGQTRSARFNAEDFDLFVGGWQLDYPDIENPLFGLFETTGGNNKYNCSHPDVDAALEAALAATDDEARIAAYQDMETAIVTNLCGVAPMYQSSLPFLVASRVGGVVPNGTIDAGQPGNYCAECWFVKAE